MHAVAVTGTELLGILDDLPAMQGIDIEAVVAVSGHGVVAIGIRGGAQSGLEGRYQILVALEATVFSLAKLE